MHGGFVLLRNAKTGLENQPASYVVGQRGSKASCAWPFTPIQCAVKNGYNYILFPNMFLRRTQEQIGLYMYYYPIYSNYSQCNAGFI